MRSGPDARAGAALAPLPEAGGAGTAATADADEVDLLELLGRTTDGMVAVGCEGRIVGWSASAARLLGYAPAEVLGRPCFEVLGWHDRYGNAVCSPSCPGCECPGPDDLVETQEVVGRSKSGRRTWLSVSTLVPPRDLRSGCRLVHLFREVALPPELERLVAERLGSSGSARGENGSPLGRLTVREREILRLLADGEDTREIARRLVLSYATVRNHIQHVLEKLGAHSRVEAVAIAHRHRL